MRPVGTVLLPIERARQLKAVATARGCGIIDLIEGLIEGAIASGEIADQTPGFRTEPNGRPGEVAFVIEDGQLGFPRIRSSTARQLADVLDGIATGGKGRRFELGERVLAMERVGRGVVLLGRENSKELGKRSITPSLARDLARQLRKAADAA